MAPVYYTSKLGNKFLLKNIEDCHDETMRELALLRNSEGNSTCADCGQQGASVWSSVNIGIFLCLRCGSLHRAVGTHISKPKGCTGTYLWGPDEISRMKEVGNIRANAIYGGIEHRPSENASNSEWITYIKNKYEHKLFAPTHRDGKVNSPNYQDKVSHKDKHSRTIKQANDKKPSIPTADLLNLNHCEQNTSSSTMSRSKGGRKNQPSDDFFAAFGV